jgi:hypothetical protein
MVHAYADVLCIRIKMQIPRIIVTPPPPSQPKKEKRKKENEIGRFKFFHMLNQQTTQMISVWG